MENETTQTEPLDTRAVVGEPVKHTPGDRYVLMEGYGDDLQSFRGYTDGQHVTICGSPADPESEDDEGHGHNCDRMGCGWEHVLARFVLPPAPASAASLHMERSPHLLKLAAELAACTTWAEWVLQPMDVPAPGDWVDGLILHARALLSDPFAPPASEQVELGQNTVAVEIER
jgi:hypothetical protein